MKTSRSKLFAVALAMGLSFSTVALIPAQAAATQADVDYSTAVSKIAVDFGKATSAWATSVANPPSLTFGKKFNDYKTRALKGTNALLVVIAKMKALKPSSGFPKSGPLLKKTALAYEKAVGMTKTAITKNDSKLMAKASKGFLDASTAFASWGAIYADEVGALNG
jgi:hypothetical protein